MLLLADVGLLLFLQMKTVSVALVLCLNVGVDPPDVVKTSPCARLECWIGEYNRGMNALLLGILPSMKFTQMSKNIWS